MFSPSLLLFTSGYYGFRLHFDYTLGWAGTKAVPRPPVLPLHFPRQLRHFRVRGCVPDRYGRTLLYLAARLILDHYDQGICVALLLRAPCPCVRRCDCLAVVSVVSLSVVVDATRWLKLVWSQVNAGGCLESFLPPSSRECVSVLATKKVCSLYCNM